ncbi:hypothetical protein OO006_10495 [Prosthecochloris sp. SCSIO W1101]|uniref:hypothetical protein n=1 Tax=Prosthecochloris sp. SCSIO W1101 TaxID=2992242 RepID=UPI00223E8E7E|nr:hypothetical protein [Prosthecochloris sp. SCSIO W1101]UZJ40778.1 hypothetical protein OO006_10495 [Prosthecochloris sp. SCSIO W1101]
MFHEHVADIRLEVSRAIFFRSFRLKATNAFALNEAYAGQTGEGIRLANLVLDI